MERDEYLAAVQKFKPHQVDWSKRVFVMSAEQEAEAKAKYESIKQRHLDQGSDELMAGVMAKTFGGERYDFAIKENELRIFAQEDNWTRPWSDVAESERNAFFKLFLSHVFSLHFHGPDAAMPDFRAMLIGLLDDDRLFLRFIDELAAE